MSTQQEIKVGLVGAAGRGGSFRAALVANGARVQAVCDINRESLDRIAEDLEVPERYEDFAEMLDQSDLDAVAIGTPMQLHVPQSVMALERGVHVLCEVPAGVTVEECRELVLAAQRSRAVYMMAENYTYTRNNVLIKELARRGPFGTVYYAEGEYLHELKELNEITTWRRKWQTGIEGITYGTHSLGPILQWMKGDRVDRVCCEGSGHHYTDPRGDRYHQDTAVMLCKMRSGGLVKIRVDMLSDRPHAMVNCQLQGTDGCYESARGGPVDSDKIWLRSMGQEMKWHDLEEAAEFLPDDWRHASEEARRAGHGGGDYFEALDFLRAIRVEKDCPIGIHEAMDMTLPGLMSQASVAQGGRWMSVPDSRHWRDGAYLDQLQMVWPERLLDRPPSVNLPAGYELRQFRDEDASSYMELMYAAGFAFWDEHMLDRLRESILPGGYFLVEHTGTRRLVATAMAVHAPQPAHPFGGELGWVAGDPEHRGKGLGEAVCAAAVGRFLTAGYRRIYLQTDDHRLPAIKTYLRIGFEPFENAPGARERWEQVRAAIRQARV